MANLERVTQMKEQGMTESQIINSLRQDGVSPKEINDALTQSKIKSSIASNRDGVTDEFSDMRRSIVEKTKEPPVDESQATDEQYQEYQEPSSYPAQQEEYYGAPPQDNSGYYQEYQQPQQPSGMDIETINDIAEQIVEEKNVELKKQMNEMKRFKDETRLDLDKINERLTKIENTFNELQMAILKRIGDYGDDIKNISEEMHSTQDSFSKILNPLTDNIRELQRITGLPSPKKQEERVSTQKEETTDEARKKPGKEKQGFEEFLR